MLTAHFVRQLRILHIEPSETDHHHVCDALGLDRSGEVITRVETLAAFRQRMTQPQPCNVVVCAYHCAGFTAMDAWDELLSLPGVPPPFIVLSRSVSEAGAIDIIFGVLKK